MKKEKYIAPELKITPLDCEDVIAASEDMKDDPYAEIGA